jgi:hypothetical protein
VLQIIVDNVQLPMEKLGHSIDNSALARLYRPKEHLLFVAGEPNQPRLPIIDDNARGEESSANARLTSHSDARHEAGTFWSANSRGEARMPIAKLCQIPIFQAISIPK